VWVCVAIRSIFFLIKKKPDAFIRADRVSAFSFFFSKIFYRKIATIGEIENIIDQHPELAGLNVTIPYKEKVIPFLDEFSEEVSEIVACNCIKIENNRLIGFNTDVPGFEKSFIKKLQPFHKEAIVLGTGGASKAIQFALSKLKIPFIVVSRNPDSSQFSYDDLNDSIIKTHQVIINTTPLGMQPNIHQYPSIPYLSITNQHYLFDLTYNPAKTVFLQKGEEMGATIVNGYEMLVNQAEGSWEIWNR
jgi:shikimate dehydrogenase